MKKHDIYLFLLLLAVILCASFISACSNDDDDSESPTRTPTPHPVGPIAYISNFTSNNVYVIDTYYNRVISIISVGNRPEGVSVNPVKSESYVVNDLDISVIDTESNIVVNTISLETNGSTDGYGIIFNPSGTKAYVTDSVGNNVIVIDTEAYSILNKIAVGRGPRGIDIDTSGSMIYVANLDDDTVSVIDAETETVVDTVVVGYTPHGITVNPSGTRVYVANLDSDDISVIDTTSNTVIATVIGLNGPLCSTHHPTRSNLFVSNFRDSTVTVINTATNQKVGNISLSGGLNPNGIAITSSGDKALVVSEFRNRVYVIDTLANVVIETIDVGITPRSPGKFIGN